MSLGRGMHHVSSVPHAESASKSDIVPHDHRIVDQTDHKNNTLLRIHTGPRYPRHPRDCNDLDDLFGRQRHPIYFYVPLVINEEERKKT